VSGPNWSVGRSIRAWASGRPPSGWGSADVSSNVWSKPGSDTGDAGLISRQRGRAAHNRLAEAIRLRIERLLRETYPDFGPTLAAEQLAERDGFVVSRETVRRIQTRLKLHKPKKWGEKRVFQVRDRRPRFGELVQIDGSPRDWFEGREPCCTLIVLVNDATSRLIALNFAPAECAAAYLEALRDQVLTYGRPLAFGAISTAPSTHRARW
jgi:hypothetical protein